MSCIAPFLMRVLTSNRHFSNTNWLLFKDTFLDDINVEVLGAITF